MSGLGKQECASARAWRWEARPLAGFSSGSWGRELGRAAEQQWREALVLGHMKSASQGSHWLVAVHTEHRGSASRTQRESNTLAGEIAAVLTGLCLELAVFEGPGSQPSLPPTCGTGRAGQTCLGEGRAC